MSGATMRTAASWAAELGVCEDSLFRLGCTIDDRGNLRWPERDGEGVVIGWSTRFDDGSKRADAGGRRGLCFVSPLAAYAGTSRDEPIILVEGLSDAATGIDLGYDAIGRPSATGGNGLLGPLVSGRHVVVVGENDSGAGRTGAEKCAAALHGHARSVRIAFPPPAHKDLRAWVAAVGLETVRPQLATLIDDAPEWGGERNTVAGMNGKARAPVLINLADVTAEPIRWTWPGVIVEGGLTGLVGDPGQGKSLATIDLAARISRGDPWPALPDRYTAPGGVLFITAEDALSTVVRPRLDAAGADPQRINALDAVVVRGENGEPVELAFTLEDVDVIEAAISQTPDCKAVFVDPVGAFMGPADGNSNCETRAILRPLAKLAERRGVGIVLVSHLRKSEGRALHRALGSIAFVAACRTAWGITKDGDDVDEFRRLMLPLKINYGPDRRGFAYRIMPPVVGEHPRLEWEPGRVDINVDVLMSGGRPGPEADEHDRACEWLRSALASGPRLADEMVEEATKGEGIAKRTLDRARKTAGVRAFRETIPGAWLWRLNA